MKHFFIIIFFVAEFVFGQITKDSTSWINYQPKNNKLNSSYIKQFSTHNLNTQLFANSAFGKFRFGVSERFLSTVIKNRAQSNIKDENLFSFFGDYNLLDELILGVAVNSNSYIGDKNITLSNSKNSNLVFYSIYKPQYFINVIPFAGYSSNSLVGLNDNGYLYGGEIISSKFIIDNFSFSGRGKFQNEDILPRKNTDRLLGISVENVFENNMRNLLSADFYEIRKDLYFDTDSITTQTFDIKKNIQSRIDRKVVYGDNLNYKPFDSPLSFDFAGNISNRLINRKTRYFIPKNVKQSDFDYKIEELKIDFNSTMNYSTSDFEGFFRINYTEKEEKYNAKNIDGANPLFFQKRQEIESQKNNKSLLTNLTVSANFMLSKNDLISISLFHRKLVYNTQSELNFDDRDELLSIAQIKYGRRINYLWNLETGAEGSLNKIVYIFSERSSNNNVTRVIKFFAGANYEGSVIKSSNYAEVSANYTVYDFEDLNPNFKSFSFRQFNFRDSTTARLSDKIYFKLFGYLKISEQAELNWDKFSSRPFRSIQEKFLEPKFELKNSDVAFAVGLRYYSLTNYRFEKNFKEKIDNYYKSVGPTAEINFQIKDSILLHTSGYYEFISRDNNLDKEQANLTLSINWNF